MGLKSFHLFAGGGGGILADILLGHRTIGAVEIESYPRKVLLARQLDGSLPQFPIWDDVRTFSANNQDTANYIEWLREIRDELVICGGFPCQDISVAGKGAGLDGERSGLWGEMFRIIVEILPRFVYVENSPAITYRGGVRVINDLTRLGYDCKWGIVGADACGLDHHRARFWMVADRSEMHGKTRDMLGESGFKSQRKFRRLPRTEISTDWRTANSGSVSVSIFRDPADGLAAEVGELEALGNGQCPVVAATAWRILSGQ